MSGPVEFGSSSRKGISVITVTLSLCIIMPLVGLATDLTMLYLLKAKLLAAADAAVLAGARALSQGNTAAAQRANAQTAAVKFFNANWTAGYWGTSNLTFPTPTVDDTTNPDYRTVIANASVSAPLYFLRMLGSNNATVSVTANAMRRDALIVLTLDRSRSMDRNVPGTGRTACEIMKEDAVEFVKYFAPGRDMVGLVVFSSGQYTYRARSNFTTPDASGNTVTSLINAIDCRDNTATTEALRAAYSEVQRVGSSTKANVIVLMTDGIPNGVTADFIAHRLSPCGTIALPMVGVLSQWANNATTGTTAGLMART